METLHFNQSELYEAISKLFTNLRKDGADRKTLEYCKTRLETLEEHWKKYQENDDKLRDYGNVDHIYFVNDDYNKARELYLATRNYIVQTIEKLATGKQQPHQLTPVSKQRSASTSPAADADQAEQKRTSNSGVMSKLDEMVKKQIVNFMAFERTVSSINLESLSNKWEFEDALSSLNTRWATIDKQHWEIQGETEGGESGCELAFDRHEETYKQLKISINTKMWSVSHRDKSTPKMEIPTFHGSYQQWTAFKDLFNETIHKNPSLSHAQKMQYLKGKVKGEAEKLIQHLTISSENYTTAWEILNHRYDNQRLIFTSHVNVLLGLPIMQQKSLTQIIKLHDVTKECLHAIKNLGVDIKSWDPLLVHILSQKLDSETYSDYLEAVKKPRDLPDLNEFLLFLETKFTVLESSRRRQDPIQKKTQQYQPRKPVSNNYNNSSNNNSNYNYQPYYKASNTKSSLHVTKTTCALCNAEHGIFSCSEFRRMPDEQKLNTITRLKFCVNCLYNHHGKQCISTKRCVKCNDNHNTLLHDAFNKPKPNNQTTKNASSSNKNQASSSSHVSQESLCDILLSTALVKVQGQNGVHVLRALIDQGSQISLISENTAQVLGLKRQQCKGIIFGVGERGNNCKGMMNLQIGSMYSDYSLDATVLIMNNLVKNLPNRTITKPTWPHISNINLADPEYNISRPVDLLLGADVYSRIVLGGVLRGESEDQPIAQQSQLGWLLCGTVKTYQCNIVLHDYENLHKFWEIEDVDIPQTNLSQEDQYCEGFYQKTTERSADGTYVVALPMKPDFEEKLGSSKAKATAQFMQLETKLNKNSDFSASYKQFMREYIDLNHMHPVNNAESNQQMAHYLPHHGVLKLDSETTKLRVVFNASSKTSSGNSLNDLMYGGPNLQQDLQALILKWRTYKYVLTADIEKFFRAIYVRESDQQLQRILWREASSDPLQEYQLSTVTYGMKAAPFLAMRTLKQLAADETTKYPLAAATINSAFYTDDMLTGHNCLKQTRQLREDIIKVLKSANMNIRKWSSNEPELLQDLSPEQLNVKFEFKSAESRKTLGLQWNPTTDSFHYHNQNTELTNTELTKRELLSAISKLFDPLGWLSPLSIRAKLIFQGTWSKELKWKLIIYYNMTTYWQGVSNIGSYVEQLKELSKHTDHLQGITQQLEQEIKEIDHYNFLLQNPDLRRQKRGLVDGIGYIANTLFGVLDERFAEQYRQDLEKIEKNENHLQNLLKNQTSVLESEYNILRRNEEIMTKQFNFINESLQRMSMKMNIFQEKTQNELYITSAALSANIILSNIRRIQETLIDTITDIYHGRINMHLLLPQQLITQMNIISGQLQGNLRLPVDRDSIRDLYRLLKVAARVVKNYLIIEIKIPLLSADVFELDRIVSIPQQRNNMTFYINPPLPYIAYNIKKDVATLLSENDLNKCTHVSDLKILCSLNTPFYDLKLKQSLCEIKLLSTLADNAACTTTTWPCRDQWIKLHNRNEWLYACCDKCHVRIYCAYGMSIEDLYGNGIISLGNGCLLKGSTYNIYAHNDLQSTINIERDIKAPKISVVNKIINTSLPDEIMPAEVGTPEAMWDQLKERIDSIKRQSEQQLTVHDVHHYSVLYIIVVFITVIIGGGAYWWCRRRRGVPGGQPESARRPRPRPREAREAATPASASASDSASVNIMPREAIESVKSVNVKCRATSPMPRKPRFAIV